MTNIVNIWGRLVNTIKGKVLGLEIIDQYIQYTHEEKYSAQNIRREKLLIEGRLKQLKPKTSSMIVFE